MGIQKNVLGQKISVFAFNELTGAGETGDAANITAEISTDFAASVVSHDANPVELESTDHPGIYVFELDEGEGAADETAGDVIVITAVSSTANIVIDPVQVFTVPENFSSMGIESDGHVHGDVKQWLGVAPGALVDTDKLQTSVQHIAMSYDYTKTNVWYVSKSGNDSNSGHSWGGAYVTIGQAITDSTAGDAIIIAPGHFEESANASSLDGLTIISQHGFGTHIDGGANAAIQLGNYTKIKGLRLTSTKTTGTVFAASKTGCVVEDCWVSGTSIVVNAISSVGFRLVRTTVTGTSPCANFYGATKWFMKDCILSTDCTYGSGNSYISAMEASGGSGLAENCMFIAERDDTTDKDTAAVNIFTDATGYYTFKNCIFSAKQANESGTGKVAGVAGETGGAEMAGTIGSVAVNGGLIRTSHAAGGVEYSLWQDTGMLSVSPALQYDTTKTNGTITVRCDAAGTAAALHATTDAAIAAQHNFDPASDTVARVTLVDTTTTLTTKTGFSLAGTALGLGPTAMVTNTDGIYQVPKGGTLGLYKRVRIWDGSNAQQADITSITYSIFALDPDDEDVRTEVTGHVDQTVLVSATIYDTLQTDTAASDYNFLYIPVISVDEAFDDAGTVYLVEFTITPTVGEVIVERFKVTAI